MSNEVCRIFLRAQGGRWRLTANDVEQIWLPTDGGLDAECNAWVMPGMNSFVAALVDAPVPISARLEVLYSLPDNSVHTIAASVGICEPQGRNAIELVTSAAPIPPTRVWDQVVPATSVRGWQSQALRHTMRVWKALADRNAAEAGSLLAFRSNEAMLTYWRPADLTPVDAAQFFSDLWEDPAWALEPIDVSQVRARLVCRNMIVELSDHEGRSLIRTRPGLPFRFSVPTYAALVRGQWELVR